MEKVKVAKLEPKNQAEAILVVADSQLVVAEEEASLVGAAAEVTEAKKAAIPAAAVNVMVTIIAIGKANCVTLIITLGVVQAVCGEAEEVDTETVPIRLPHPSFQIYNL